LGICYGVGSCLVFGYGQMLSWKDVQINVRLGREITKLRG